MRYAAMLAHADDSWCSPGFCCAGSAAVPGRAIVWTGRVAGHRGAGVGGQPDDHASVVSRVAEKGPGGVEGGRSSRPQAAPQPPAVGRGGGRTAERPCGPRLRHHPVDVAADRRGHRPTDGGALSPRACLAHPAGIELVAATARAPSAGARRGRHSPVATPALAAGKKNARRRHAWIVFEDESGISQQPVVRRTWAPRGQTPVLTSTGANWQRLSVAGALAFRWDARRTRFYFQTRPGSYTDVALIAFVRQLKRHFRGRRVWLLWGGLGAHRRGAMRAYVGRQRAWLTVERLPGYAPEMNQIEQVWGNVKGGELANVCAADLAALRHPAHRGFARIRRQPHLAFAFLRHAGLTL